MNPPSIENETALRHVPYDCPISFGVYQPGPFRRRSTRAARPSRRPEHDPGHRHPALPGRRIQRVGHPDVAGRRRRQRRPVAQQRHRADDQRPRAAEPGADDDEVALQVHRRRPRRRSRQNTTTRKCGSRAAGRERQVGDHRAEPGADQRHADEVGGDTASPAPISPPTSAATSIGPVSLRRTPSSPPARRG